MHLKRFLSQMNSKEFVKYFLHEMQSLGTSFQLATNTTVMHNNFYWFLSNFECIVSAAVAK